jgi:hypothetical protein
VNYIFVGGEQLESLTNFQRELEQYYSLLLPFNLPFSQQTTINTFLREYLQSVVAQWFLKADRLH